MYKKNDSLHFRSVDFDPFNDEMTHSPHYWYTEWRHFRPVHWLNESFSPYIRTGFLHGGLTFGPLSPPSRDGICMPKQVWSTFFLFEIFDHMINSLRIRRFGPYSNSSNMQVWSTSNRKSGPNLRIRTDLMPRDHKLFEFAGLVHFFCSKWTKPAYSKSLNLDQTCVFEEN